MVPYQNPPLKRPRANAVICRIASVAIDVENKKEMGNAQNEISCTLDKNEVAAHNIIQELPMKAGSLLVIGMCLEYFVIRNQQKVQTNEKLFRPSQIIYAVYN